MTTSAPCDEFTTSTEARRLSFFVRSALGITERWLGTAMVKPIAPVAPVIFSIGPSILKVKVTGFCTLPVPHSLSAGPEVLSPGEGSSALPALGAGGTAAEAEGGA